MSTSTPEEQPRPCRFCRYQQQDSQRVLCASAHSPWLGEMPETGGFHWELDPAKKDVWMEFIDDNFARKLISRLGS